MGSYISSFKKFMKGEEKKTDEKIGANPQMVREEDAVVDPIPDDPALKAKYDALNTKKTEILNAEKALTAKKDELSKLQADYDKTASEAAKQKEQQAAAATAATPQTA